MTDRISTADLRKLLADATDGPWELHDCENFDGRATYHYKEVWDTDLNVIASEVYRAHNDGGRANMRLIAAAPDLAAEVIELREALENVMGHIDTPIARRRLGINTDQPEWLTEARALNHKETNNGTS